MYTQIGLMLLIATRRQNAILIVEVARGPHNVEGRRSSRPPSKPHASVSAPS